MKIASRIRPSPGAFRPFPLPLGEGGAKRRVRVAGFAADSHLHPSQGVRRPFRLFHRTTPILRSPRIQPRPLRRSTNSHPRATPAPSSTFRQPRTLPQTTASTACTSPRRTSSSPWSRSEFRKLPPGLGTRHRSAMRSRQRILSAPAGLPRAR